MIQRNSVVEFNENNARFWNSLELPVRHLPTSLPIESFFCQGFGRRYFEFGECVQMLDWTNQLMQEPQANCEIQRIDCTDALMGGSCLLFGDLNEPILRLKCKWTGDLFVLLVYKHKASDAAFQVDRGLFVLGHGANSIAFGSGMALRCASLMGFYLRSNLNPNFHTDRTFSPYRPVLSIETNARNSTIRLPRFSRTQRMAGKSF